MPLLLHNKQNCSRWHFSWHAGTVAGTPSCWISLCHADVYCFVISLRLRDDRNGNPKLGPITENDAMKHMKVNSLDLSNIVFQSLKTDIQAKGGNVICLGTLLGNIDIHVSDESVSKCCLKLTA